MVMVVCLLIGKLYKIQLKELKKLEKDYQNENIGFTKKEILKFGKERDKLQRF